jgi:hypothetical protein
MMTTKEAAPATSSPGLLLEGNRQIVFNRRRVTKKLDTRKGTHTPRK